MPFFSETIEITTQPGINIHNLTDRVSEIIRRNPVKNGYVIVFSRHTTCAVAINEYEERLLADIQVFLRKLAPEGDKYLHNDLHLRPNIPPDEPMNAHSHLMAMLLNNTEIIPIVDGKLALGTYQSILFFELDGARSRSIFCQIFGE